MLVLLLIVWMGMLGVQAERCDANQYEFRGTYSLGKQDELNRTFTKIQNLTYYLMNVNKTGGDNIRYAIYSAKPHFTYKDSKQKAQVINNNTIAISGGRVETEIIFQWDKTINRTTYYGKGTAIGTSD